MTNDPNDMRNVWGWEVKWTAGSREVIRMEGDVGEMVLISEKDAYPFFRLIEVEIHFQWPSIFKQELAM